LAFCHGRMTKTKCRWGFMGAANIARKNWQAVRDAGNAELVAVASRDAARSARFIEECQSQVPQPITPVALGSYEELLAREDIDAVYVPLPTGLRKEWVIRAARAGKHVLCEKPAAMSAADLQEMIAACRDNNVQFMDGVMFMHHPRLEKMRSVLEARTLGEIRHITSQFTFAGGDEFLGADIRTDAKLEPMGCLGDLGWYCSRLTLWALGWQAPVSVCGHILQESGHGGGSVPTEFSAELYFPGGVSASYFTSFHVRNTQTVVISGTNGALQFNDFVLPLEGDTSRYDVVQSAFGADGCVFVMQDGRQINELTVPANNAPGSQEANMIASFSNIVLSGVRDARWEDWCLLTQRVVDAAMTSARQGGAPVSLADA
jgi:predicted dehydrogenase